VTAEVGALGLGDDELSVEKLDGFAAEQPETHEPLVLDSLPPPDGQRGLHDPSRLMS
jgi:hypothetical protein